jgi:hypothetical protein
MVMATSMGSMGINAMDMLIHTKKKGRDVPVMPTTETTASSMSMATLMSINMGTANPQRRSKNHCQLYQQCSLCWVHNVLVKANFVLFVF